MDLPFRYQLISQSRNNKKRIGNSFHKIFIKSLFPWLWSCAASRQHWCFSSIYALNEREFTIPQIQKQNYMKKDQIKKSNFIFV